MAGVVVAAGCGILGCESSVSDAEIEFVGLGEVRALAGSDDPKAVLFIDPRPPAAFGRGHIPGARNYQLSRFKSVKGETEPEIDKFKTLVVYGDDPGSGSARGMAKRLMTTGYDPVLLFSGGMLEWERAGLPVERDPGAPGAEPTEGKAPAEGAARP